MADLIAATAAANLLTFDVEDWYHANFANLDFARFRGQASQFRANMEWLLDACAQAGCQATFFVLGTIAEDYPEVVRSIAAAGHEVASHGYSHQLAYQQSLDEFRADVKRSTDILQTVTGQAVKGYRAPSWSIVSKNLHYLAALEALGLQYDASIFPVKTFLYGIPDAPTEIHRPVIAGRRLELYAVPMSVRRIFGRNIGYSGGFYFRLLPTWFIRQSIQSANRQGQSSIVYLHPRELDPTERRLQLPRLESFIQYHNVGGVRKKLANILGSFRFVSIAARLAEIKQLQAGIRR